MALQAQFTFGFIFLWSNNNLKFSIEPMKVDFAQW